ncbi:hypothetical protein AURDEDRAFT_129367 [Auricularia subglabra TFB-10046 SS5]|uniref:Uncharacterized protein n=1 Tax=Auricularia subglabra (strain TFB-10046 / SS5) TaxID=717982 RepID=J0WW65_AURST|nr:hypothetical protein AURDEDRAFT_129367 [Auricularia subglabra TFB-10046 SS5]
MLPRSFRSYLLGLRAQVTIYEAGESAWSSAGSVATVARATLEAFCADSSIPIDGVEGTLKAYVLTSRTDAVKLKFNGSGVAIYGITFAHDSCEIGINPIVAILDIGAAPGTPTTTTATATSSGLGPQPSCESFPTPVAACNRLLAQWDGLSPQDLHSIAISTDGRQLAILNAQVTLDASDSDVRPSVLPPDLPPDATLGVSSTTLLLPTSIFQFSSDAGATSPPSDVSQTGLSASQSQLPIPDNSGTSLSASSRQSDVSTAGAGASPARAVRIILPSVLGGLAVLAFLFGLLFFFSRQRRRQHQRLALSSAPTSQPDLDAGQGTNSLNPPTQPDAQLSQKHHGVKALFRAEAPRATPEPGSLRQAIENAGLTPGDVVASLNRLREQARAGHPSGEWQDPGPSTSLTPPLPRYTG